MKQQPRNEVHEVEVEENKSTKYNLWRRGNKSRRTKSR